MGDTESRVAWVRLARDAAPGEWLLPELEAIREGGEARVVVLDATGAEAVEAMGAEQLRALTLFALPVVCCFEGEPGEGMADIALAADIRVCGAGGALAVRPGAERLDAEALLQAGLVTAVAAAGEAAGEARRVAGVIASRGPIATRLAKEAIKRGAGQPLEQALRFETDLTLLLQTTKDRAEGVRAFLEKRPPLFTGE
ncbi:MAG: enoyl-CoA hydratase-related protein [Chloroflexi bacterium]|nr:enoyl-CoA hydratase-related protein [Chloroflexota bacterium]MCZ7577538.1 enoyl-CoA hydratase-related protein [Dehalococcoidia bacterium]